MKGSGLGGEGLSWQGRSHDIWQFCVAYAHNVYDMHTAWQDLPGGFLSLSGASSQTIPLKYDHTSKLWYVEPLGTLLCSTSLASGSL